VAVPVPVLHFTSTEPLLIAAPVAATPVRVSPVAVAPVLALPPPPPPHAATNPNSNKPMIFLKCFTMHPFGFGRNLTGDTLLRYPKKQEYFLKLK
jgi:hypothetical protein